MVVYTDTSKEFQSTPPRRRRPQLAASQASQNISIHASAKEATKSTTATTAAKKISIHASAKEATVYNGTIDWKKVKFQSTPPRRRRPISSTVVGIRKPFQSTPPRRRRPQHIVIPQLSCTYLVSTTFLSTFFSFISQYVVLFFLF